MKLYVLVIVFNTTVTTQEFFNETACMRTVHELTARGVKTAFCTPKKI